MKKLLIAAAFILTTFKVFALAACMTNITIVSYGTATISLGTGTNQYTSIGGLDIIASSCSLPGQSDTPVWFHANCCPTNTVVIATVTWACNDAVKCGGGEGGVGTCGNGGSFNISLDAGESEVWGYISYGTQCCGLVWCAAEPVTCTGQGWATCSYSNGNSSTNSPPND